MDKVYSVYVSKEIVEDNWDDGEIGNRQCLMYNEFYGKEATLKEAIDRASNIAFGIVVPMSDFALVNNGQQIAYSRTENKNGEVPSEEEITKWKEGKINLYSANYYFRVEIQSSVSKEDYEALGISE